MNFLRKHLTYAIIKKLKTGESKVRTVKEGIHPQYHQAQVTCACGESFVTGSTKKEIRVEICSNCHPFFTGKQRIVDSGGQVEKFQKRMKKTEKLS